MGGKDKWSCKVCEKSFSSERGLHIHIPREHKITLAGYYTNFYPRLNLLTGEPLSFKDKKEYFRKSFENISELTQWSKNAEKEEVKKLILDLLKNRIIDKDWSHAPNYLELKLCGLPPIDLYRNFFGSYSKACELLKIKPLFEKQMMANFFSSTIPKDMEILVDTREQAPLSFAVSRIMKLDFGDYTTSSKYYNYTYVDRKSESDFKGSIGKGFARLRRELQRAKDFDSFLYIVVEESLDGIISHNYSSPFHSTSMAFLWHNMRKLTHEFHGYCQFIFSGSREESEHLIPRLLYFGRKMWQVDLQYYIDKRHDLGNRKTEI